MARIPQTDWDVNEDGLGLPPSVPDLIEVRFDTRLPLAWVRQGDPEPSRLAAINTDMIQQCTSG
jgi:hypothetical protein